MVVILEGVRFQGSHYYDVVQCYVHECALTVFFIGFSMVLSNFHKR